MGKLSRVGEEEGWIITIFWGEVGGVVGILVVMEVWERADIMN